MGGPRATEATGLSSNDTIKLGDGYSVVIGGAGGDGITVGNGNDYLFGDNAQVQYAMAGGANIVTRAASIAGANGGDDRITAGNGDNAVVGGVGNDTISLGNGDNLAIGDSGEIVQAFDANGNAITNTTRDASGHPVLHRDIVLEKIATITGEFAIDSAASLTTALAGMTAADMSLLVGAYDASGARVLTAAGYWQTDVLTLSLVPDGNDTITVGNGTNTVIGQGGNNAITAGNGNNTIFGNAASNTSTLQSDIPNIVNAVMIAGVTGVPSIAVGPSGQIVVPLADVQPYALLPVAPGITMGPAGPGTLSGLAEGGSLTQVAGGQLTVIASIEASLANSSPALPGQQLDLSWQRQQYRVRQRRTDPVVGQDRHHRHRQRAGEPVRFAARPERPPQRAGLCPGRRRACQGDRLLVDPRHG